MGSMCSSIDDTRQPRSEVAGSDSKPSVHITAYNSGNAVPGGSGFDTNCSISAPPGNDADSPSEKDSEPGERSIADDVTTKSTDARTLSESDGPKHEENTILISDDQRKLAGGSASGRGGNSNSSDNHSGKATASNENTTNNKEPSNDNANCNTKVTSLNETKENRLMDVGECNTQTDPEEKKLPVISSDHADLGDLDTDSGLDGEDIDDIVMTDLDFDDGGLEISDPSADDLSPRDAAVEMASLVELGITKPAPDFECNAVVNGSFQTVKLSSYRGKYVVLFFYPLDFTFVCPTEIIAFSDRAEEFRAINCEVLACSTDSVYSHLAWIDTPRKQGGLGPMKIPLLADRTQEVTKKYGCFKADEGIAFRGLYIIDGKGNLRQMTINDLPVGRSVDETLRLVQAFQFTDKHGEVCPAGWKPGKETMKPDPKESQKFFKQVN